MQQNIKGLLLLIFLIVFSFVSFQYFDDDVETVSVPSTTSTTTTTVAVVKIEPYKVPAFNLEEIISSSLEKIDIVCERTGNWFSLTSSCLEQWNNAYIAITENKALYYEHYEYSRTYFIENYKYLEKDDIEVIISSLAINEKLNFFVNELTEVSEVLAIKKDSTQNSTSIFLSDDAIQNAKSIGTEDLLGGCYLDVENEPSDIEWVEVPSGNTKDSSKFNYGIKIGVNFDNIGDIKSTSSFKNQIETASSNPRIVDQYSSINALNNYKKFYLMGGSASWRNVRSLLKNNINDMAKIILNCLKLNSISSEFISFENSKKYA